MTWLPGNRNRGNWYLLLFPDCGHAESVVTLSPWPPALQPDSPWLPPDLQLLVQQQVLPKQP
jgi:hypothetical protein